MEPQEILTRDIIIVGLSLLTVLCLLKIRALKKYLAEEKRKRLVPLLSLEIDTDDFAADLYNDSYCHAHDIQISDLNIKVDVGFKKGLILKFDPIDFLKPNQKKSLTYKVFDGQYDVTSKESINLVIYFRQSDFQMRVSYKNMENDKFEAVIAREGAEFLTKEVTPTK